MYTLTDKNGIVNTQAITALNHAGVCMSYTGTWNLLRELIVVADYSERVKHGRWIWIYDNFNIHQTTRHERQGKWIVPIQL